MAVRTLWPRRTSSPRENTGWLSSGGRDREQVPASSGENRTRTPDPQSTGNRPTAFLIKAWGSPASGCSASCTFLVLAPWPGSPRSLAGPGPGALPSGCPIPFWSPGLPTAAAVPDGAASFGLGGWFAEISTDPAPALCFQMNMQPRFQLNYQKHLSFLTDSTTGMEKEVS